MDKNNYIGQLTNLFLQIESSITEADVQQLLSITKIKKYAAGEHFVELDSMNTDFAFVLSGLFKFYYNTFDGKEFIQAFQKENDFMLSYYPVMTGKPSPFGAQALEDSVVLQGSYQELESFYEKSDHWNTVARKLYQLNFIKKVEREFDLLLHDTKTRYFKFVETHPNLASRITKQQIAMYLGMTPVSLSRIINAK